MPYSTCCGAHTTMTEQDICPICRYYCDWEDDEQQDDDVLVQVKPNSSPYTSYDPTDYETE
jgi:hypothetical protein